MERLTQILLIAAMATVAFSMVGAGHTQVERPPQPFFQDFFSGIVTVEGSPPPAGTLLIACIDECGSVFESEPYSLRADGSFDQLEVNPNTEVLIGHTITFYLVNEFGRIQANEQRPYIGVFDFYVQDLTFELPLPRPLPTPSPTMAPLPTPTASLPIAGDPSVTKLPKIAIITGSIASVSGILLLLVVRRRSI